jgi:beta-N-acetylhexosaminidase
MNLSLEDEMNAGGSRLPNGSAHQGRLGGLLRLEDHLPATADSLDLDACIGQILCFGWQGDDCTSVNEAAREIVEDMQVGGVILLARNVDTPEQTRDMLRDLQNRARIPLLIAVDQEGGRVNRFGPPMTAFPGSMALGACGSRGVEYAYRQAKAQASELAAVGVNWNLAPVLDVNNNPANPIIGVRSYGEDPQLVANLGMAAIRGYRDGGVLACAKHFPGHGNTEMDSHLGLPTVASSRGQLEATELLPFRAAIQAGVPAIMSTHIVFPALDAVLPATLSATILTDLLRTEMRFDGLIVTDCLEMAAIAETIGTPMGAVAALRAGADMVLVSHTLETQREVYRAIRQAVEAEILSEERVREAAGRVLAAKARALNMPEPPAPEPWHDPSHASLEMEIARESVTVVRNAGVIPLRHSERIGVVCFDASGRALAEALTSLGHPASAFELRIDTNPAAWVEAVSRLSATEVIVVLTALSSTGHGAAEARAVQELHARFGRRLVAAGISSPFDLVAYPQVETYLCTYGSRPCSVVALAEVVAGKTIARGRLPVTFAVATE